MGNDIGSHIRCHLIRLSRGDRFGFTILRLNNCRRNLLDDAVYILIWDGYNRGWLQIPRSFTFCVEINIMDKSFDSSTLDARQGNVGFGRAGRFNIFKFALSVFSISATKTI